MQNVISAQELKRRGIGAVDQALREGPVHVISRNRPSYVILSEAQYQSLVAYDEASARLWDVLLGEGSQGTRTADDIDQQIQSERDAWS